MNYVYLGVLFGRAWKYIVVGLFVITGLFLLLSRFIPPPYPAIISIGSSILLLIYVIYKASIAERKQRQHQKTQNESMRNQAGSLEIDKNKCMSCLSPLKSGTVCQECGFDNS